MGNQHGATEVSGSEARHRPRALSGKYPALRSRLPRAGCLRAAPLLPSAGASPQDTPSTLSAAFFFFFSNKITTQIRAYFSLCQPRQNFQRVPPTPRGPPFPSQKPLRGPHPQHVTNCYISFFGSFFAGKRTFNDWTKVPPSWWMWSSSMGRRGKLIEGWSAKGGCCCLYLRLFQTHVTPWLIALRIIQLKDEANSRGGISWKEIVLEEELGRVLIPSCKLDYLYLISLEFFTMLAELSEIPEYQLSSLIMCRITGTWPLLEWAFSLWPPPSPPFPQQHWKQFFLYGLFPQAANYFQNAESSPSVENICPGWVEPWKIMLEERGGQDSKNQSSGKVWCRARGLTRKS